MKHTRVWSGALSTFILLTYLVTWQTCLGQIKPQGTRSAADESWMAVVEAAVVELPWFSNIQASIVFPEKLPSWPVCAQPKALLVSGATVIGKVPVNLRCESPRWSGSLAVVVEGRKRHFIAARSIKAGTVIRETDFAESESDWTKLPADVVTDGDQILGRTLVRSIQQGQTFALKSVRQTAVIRVGERVQVQMVGANFTISGDGVAAQQGFVGESIRVKMASGKLVTANVLKPGVVELRLD